MVQEDGTQLHLGRVYPFHGPSPKLGACSEEPEQGRRGGQSRDLAKAWSPGARIQQSLPRGDRDPHQGKCMSFGATQAWMEISGKQFFPLRIAGRVK